MRLWRQTSLKQKPIHWGLNLQPGWPGADFRDTIQMDNLVLTVEQVIGRRIRKVRAKKASLPLEIGDKNLHAE